MTADNRAEILGLLEKGWSYQLIADALGVTRCAVAGIIFRHKHSRVELVKSPHGRGANKLGTGFTQASYAPKYSARNFQVQP